MDFREVDFASVAAGGRSCDAVAACRSCAGCGVGAEGIERKSGLWDYGSEQ